jgi:hypothetical protein
LSPISGDLVLLARFQGIEHRELIERILAAAVARVGLLHSSIDVVTV